MSEIDIFTEDSKQLSRLIKYISYRTDAANNHLEYCEKHYGADDPITNEARGQWCVLDSILMAAKDPAHLKTILGIWEDDK